MRRPLLLHLTTTDISLALLLGPQLRAFTEAGYEVVACSADGSYVPRLEASGIRHIALQHSTRGNDPLADLRTFADLVQLLRELKPDIVHTHNPKPGVLGRLAAQVCGVPVVVNTNHGLYAQPSDRLARRVFVYAAERVAASCSDAELIQNEEDLAVLRRLGIPRDKLHLLGNGVDLKRFSPQAAGPEARQDARREFGVGPDDIVVGAVGRLVWEKGFGELFDAADELRKRAPNVRFVVVGPPEPGKPDAVSDAAVERAKSRGVRFLGSRDDMPRLYTAFDIFVLASYREGFPRSAMEAAAMGLPVVATDIRGCRQVVEAERTGLLVPVRDAEALARAISRLASSAAEREIMGQAARAKAVREFDQEEVIDTTLRTYERLLGRRKPSVPPRTGELQLRLGTRHDVDRVASLHHEQLASSFLASLGETFLRRLYRRIVLSPRSFLIVADVGDTAVAGFVAGTADTADLYRRFLLRDAMVAGLLSLPQLIRSPPRALETLRYGSRPPLSVQALPPAELLSLGVDPSSRRRGVGRELVRAFQQELAQLGVFASRVVVESSNEAALRLYQECGFRPSHSLELHRGARSEVLVWP